ncbi:MAG: AraC family transcriptional regulator [Woeseiaceae bacterium]
MGLSITTIFGLLGVLQGLTLAVAIATLGGDTKRPNRALAAILLVLSGTILVVVVDHARITNSPLVLVLLEYTLALLYGPLLWNYVNAVLGNRPKARLWRHFLPLALWLLYLVAIFLQLIGGEPWQWRLLPPIMALVTYLVGYTVAAAVRVWRARNDEQMLVTHGLVLRTLIVLVLALHVAQIVRYVFRDIGWLTNVVPLTGTVSVIVMSALAFRQSRLFAGHESEVTKKKYKASTLSPEHARQIANRLLALMERDKPYLNENLNAPELAARLSIPKAHLSQVLNGVLDIPVRDFINQYRVTAAVDLIGNPDLQYLTVEEIGYAAGFRSRSAFHTAFKRETGKTPAEMRAEVS